MDITRNTSRLSPFITNLYLTTNASFSHPAQDKFIFLLFPCQVNLDSFYLHSNLTAFAIPGSASGCLALGLGAMDGPGPQGGAAGIKAPYDKSIM